MPNKIVDTLLEDQKHLAPHVRTKWNVLVFVGLVEFESDIPGGQNIAREPTHSLSQIIEIVLLWIDGPNDVTHRINQLARRAGNHRQRRRQLSIARINSLTHHFAENRYLSQARCYIVVQISRDPAAHSFQFGE